MKLSNRPVRRWPSILALTILAAALSACVQAPAVFLTANTCSTLVPEDWYSKGVESAALPADKTVGSWVSFGIAQTGQLDKANSQTRDAVAIIRKCESFDKAAADAMQPKPWWRIW